MMKLAQHAYIIDGTVVVQYLKQLAHIPDDKGVDVKISFDGSSKGFVHAAVNLLNTSLPTQLRDLTTQLRDLPIPIMIYDGKEEADLL